MHYRPPAEREADAARDPLDTGSRRYLLEQGVATEAELEAIRPQVEDEVAVATETALASPQPATDTIYEYVYSPDVDPTVGAVRHRGRSRSSPAIPTTMVDLLNSCLRDEMARDPRIVIFGEDVADVHPRGESRRGEGQGRRLQGHLGAAEAVRQRPGLQLARWPRRTSSAAPSAWPRAGIKPVVEIQFFDYIWPAYMQIRNELAIMRWRSNNTFAAPVVVRVTYGGYLKGGADLPLPDRRGDLHRHPGAPGGLSRHRARRQRPAAHRDPLRGPGALPRAQASLPPDLQQGALSRPQLHDPLRQGEGGAGRDAT